MRDVIQNVDLSDYLKKTFAEAYFQGYTIKGITITHPVDIEAEKQAVNRLEQGNIDEYVVAWKAGRVKRVDKDGNFELDCYKGKEAYKSGYGSPIMKKELHEYLEKVKEKWEMKLSEEKDFAVIYKSLHEGAPSNFGSVYIINLIFFLSKGEYPIYDQFAHRAIKAIFMKKMPYQVYIGTAPDKHNCDDVINMYSEYLWLLDSVFGIHNIEREMDRALWVLGHADDKYYTKENKEKYDIAVGINNVV